MEVSSQFQAPAALSPRKEAPILHKIAGWMSLRTGLDDFPSLNNLNDHIQSHYTRYDSSGRVLGPSQRPLPDKTQHSKQTSMYKVTALYRAATGIGSGRFRERNHLHLPRSEPRPVHSLGTIPTELPRLHTEMRLNCVWTIEKEITCISRGPNHVQFIV